MSIEKAIDLMAEYFDKNAKSSKKKLDPKAKVRNRPSPAVQSTHPKVKDNKDHFPMSDENQARNAWSRVNQYSSAPPWWSGSLEELKNIVKRKVHGKYPGIKMKASEDKIDQLYKQAIDSIKNQ